MAYLVIPVTNCRAATTSSKPAILGLLLALDYAGAINL